MGRKARQGKRPEGGRRGRESRGGSEDGDRPLAGRARHTVGPLAGQQCRGGRGMPPRAPNAPAGPRPAPPVRQPQWALASPGVIIVLALCGRLPRQSPTLSTHRTISRRVGERRRHAPPCAAKPRPARTSGSWKSETVNQRTTTRCLITFSRIFFPFVFGNYDGFRFKCRPILLEKF